MFLSHSICCQLYGFHKGMGSHLVEMIRSNHCFALAVKPPKKYDTNYGAQVHPITQTHFPDYLPILQNDNILIHNNSSVV